MDTEQIRNLEQIRAWVATRRQPVPRLLTQTSYESTALHHIDDLLAAIDDLEVVCAAWRRAASLAANDAADRKAAIDRVLALHTQTSDIEGSFCGHCSFDWPCETVRAVEHE